MPERTIEDRLRQEYFDLLPEIRRVETHLKALVQFNTLPILLSLGSHEQLVVKSRVKDCESAINALRRRTKEGKRREFATFDRSRPDDYSLLDLRDLAAVRVLAFPPSRLEEIDQELKPHFPTWASDPIRNDLGEVLARKYCGYFPHVGDKVMGEYQIVSMLTGLFWDVEHASIYKPNPELRGAERNSELQELTGKVYDALASFEQGFERAVMREKL
jgi:hypothetical protein